MYTPYTDLGVDLNICFIQCVKAVRDDLRNIIYKPLLGVDVFLSLHT